MKVYTNIFAFIYTFANLYMYELIMQNNGNIYIYIYIHIDEFVINNDIQNIFIQSNT